MQNNTTTGVHRILAINVTPHRLDDHTLPQESVFFYQDHRAEEPAKTPGPPLSRGERSRNEGGATAPSLRETVFRSTTFSLAKVPLPETWISLVSSQCTIENRSLPS